MKRFLTVLSILLCCVSCICIRLSYASYSDYIKINYNNPNSKISKKIYNLQVKSANAFLKIAEITYENANLKLKRIILEKSIFSNNINSSSVICEKFDKLLEYEKEYIDKVNNGVKIAKKHLKETKVGFNNLNEIIKTYIYFTDKANDFVNLISQEDTKNSFGASSKDIDFKSYSKMFFNDQIKATELLTEFYKYKAKHIVDRLKLTENNNTIKQISLEETDSYDKLFDKLFNLDLEFNKVYCDLVQARIKLAEAYALAAMAGLVVFPEIANTLITINKNLLKKNKRLTKAIKNLSKNKPKYYNCFLKKILKLEKKYIKVCKKDISRIREILKCKDNNKIILCHESIAILKAKLNVLEREILLSSISLRYLDINLEDII